MSTILVFCSGSNNLYFCIIYYVIVAFIFISTIFFEMEFRLLQVAKENFEESIYLGKMWTHVVEKFVFTYWSLLGNQVIFLIIIIIFLV